MMVDYIKEDLEEALSALESMIRRSEKVQPKLKEGSSQASLTKNRLKALHISSSLITKELKGEVEDFTKEELEKALLPLTSTIHKCEKAVEKLKVGSFQLTLTKKMLKALHISLSLITRELDRL
jgi:molecular chaperone GrpE (heat shock protein)